jgi:hypothetical protein
MAFPQLTYRESLRDIEACLAAQAAKLYHMGLGEPVRRATLADANESRDWRIYAGSPTDRTTGVIADQTVALDGPRTRQDYPVHLRRIRFRNAETTKTLIFLTNQAALPALTICDLYKSRWQVELFFKWIKQHLRIQRLYGTSENAVKSRIWIAVSVYVLVAVVRKRLNLEAPLHTLLQVFSVTVFEKIEIQTAFSREPDRSEYSQREPIEFFRV